MQVRDRIKELRRVPAAELRPNPRNWRTHPTAQRDALRGVLAEVGYASALLARELEDGSLELIDGHLRAETTPDILVPVLVLDVNRQEADTILATHDPLASFAETDQTLLQDLLGGLEVQNAAVQSLLDGIGGETPLALPDELNTVRPDVAIPQSFQVVVQCADEREQQTVFERLRGEGYACRLLML